MSIFLVMMIIPCIVILSFIMRKVRQSTIEKSMTLVDAKTQELKIQEHKDHHQTEAVLGQNSQTLNLYRRIDASIILKIGLAVMLTVVGIVASQLMGWELARNDYVVVGIISLVITIVLPSTLRAMYVKKRVKKLTAELPWMIDLLAVSIQCGMTPEQAFKFLSTKMSGINPDFVPFLQRLVRRTEMSGLSNALYHFSREIPSTETRLFCAMLEQSLQYGSSLYDQLMELSREIREIQLLTTEENIGKLSAKMSVPLILFFMFPVVIIVAAPGIMRVFSNG
ncbi:type II secretion system F family protein [Tatumella sp. TA1]|uniref:type II secretion system F family protein n=1 Tax=Rosenbergiella collisarenosi TaxID=1544695 RepID=UPI0012FD956F|nr:type II secretion system F family protein [Rosenbergiella collisarenosi]MBT0722566.1 type II secretion system F family protein [Rosenbergiella collisarenosi]QGX90727.1 type II secretion system F family protein [Tatumella sp. TA1]